MKLLLKYSIVLILPVLALAACEEDYEDKLTGNNPQGNAVDVSNRITGFEQEVTGGGARLTAVGNDLSGVKRVMVASELALDVEAAASSVTFTVPVETPLGMQDFHFIFSGNERAVASIEVKPLPSVAYVDPVAGKPGDVISVIGNDLDFVETVNFGDIEAEILEQEKGRLTFTVPEGAAATLSLSGSTGIVELTEGEFVVCPSEDFRCLPPLNHGEFNGNFEAGVTGVVGSGGDHGGHWYLAASGTRATYEIFNAEGVPGLGEKTLKVSIIELGTNNWDIQIVNDGFEVTPGKRFVFSGRIWSDATGRKVRVAGGVSIPGYQDMAGGTDVILESGWNAFAVDIQHIRATEQLETQIRLQANFSFPENAGATFYFDDFRVVEVGDRVDCSADPDLYFELFGGDSCP